MLDVQMPGLTGFEVARRLLRGGTDSHLVFVTAYDRHAIEAFDVNAVDYLLKPVEADRLAMAVERVRKRMVPERPVARLLRATSTACCSCSASARTAGSSWRSRSATGSCCSKPTRLYTPRSRTT